MKIKFGSSPSSVDLPQLLCRHSFFNERRSCETNSEKESREWSTYFTCRNLNLISNSDIKNIYLHTSHHHNKVVSTCA